MAGATVVFVEPPYVCWDRRRDRVREGEEEIPGIGTLTLAAVAREHGHRVHVVDGKRTGTPVEEVARRVAALAPDHVGISATTISIHNAARIAARVKALRPACVVTVGGPHVSAVPERTLAAFPGFDYGIVGEGERSYVDLIARVGAAADPRGVAGLVWREPAGVRANPAAPAIRHAAATPNSCLADMGHLRDGEVRRETPGPTCRRWPVASRVGRGRAAWRPTISILSRPARATRPANRHRFFIESRVTLRTTGE